MSVRRTPGPQPAFFGPVMVACERVIDGVQCTAERCRAIYVEDVGRWVRKFCGPCAEKVAPDAIKNDEARRRNAELGKAVVKKTE